MIKTNSVDSDSSENMTVPIGIDLGTTQSCIGVYQNGKVEIMPNLQNNKTTPSCVAFTDRIRFIGNEAKTYAGIDPENTMYAIKRMLGKNVSDISDWVKDWPFAVKSDNGIPKVKVQYRGEKKSFYPEQLTSMILEKMKDTAEAYLGKTIVDVVVTVPANFGDSERKATLKAGKIAGLNIVQLLNEPTAAALAYGFDKNFPEKKIVLVFDFGGGTLDVSVLSITNGTFTVLSTAGDPHLGGEDFDHRVAKYFVNDILKKYKRDISSNTKALNRIKLASEEAKKTLSGDSGAHINIDYLLEGINFQSYLDRNSFESINEDLFLKALGPVERALKNANVCKTEVDEVVMVGGSTKIPKVRQIVREYFNGKDLLTSINPEEAIAVGPTIQAAKILQDPSLRDMEFVTFDVTPMSLGIEVEAGKMSVVIHRNSTLPIERTQRYTTHYDGQTEIEFCIYEGEREVARYNKKLGQFSLTKIPHLPAEVPSVEVLFSIDVNGVLKVSATGINFNEQKEILIKERTNSLNSEDITLMMQELKTMQMHDKEEIQRANAVNRLEEYCLTIQMTCMEDDVRKALGGTTADDIKHLCDIDVWLEHNQDASTKVIVRKLKQLKNRIDPLLLVNNDQESIVVKLEIEDGEEVTDERENEENVEHWDDAENESSEDREVGISEDDEDPQENDVEIAVNENAEIVGRKDNRISEDKEQDMEEYAHNNDVQPPKKKTKH